MNRGNARIRRPVALVMALLALVLTTWVWATGVALGAFGSARTAAGPARFRWGRRLQPRVPRRRLQAVDV